MNTMNFCEICNNMYYMKIEETEEGKNLLYWCRNCDNTKLLSKKESNCIVEKYYNKEEKNYKDYINKYTTEDPTLPRVNNIICPNKSCESNQDNGEDKREVIYIKYDNEKLRYIYLCCLCKTAWRNNIRNKNEVEILEV